MKNLNSTGLRFTDGRLFVLDQTLLPHQETWLEMRELEQMIEAIQMLRVRGAPLIGVSAAVYLAMRAEQGVAREEFLAEARRLVEARPTAVNLKNAIDRMVEKIAHDESTKAVNGAVLVAEAERIFGEDVECCHKMAELALPLFRDGDGVLTHCNSGGLATVGLGTALGAILYAHQNGKRLHVWVDETRPLLQGARLTTWELGQARVPYQLIADNMAASLMRAGKVQKIFVGADRIAQNGDFANKIGTYSLAVLARHHGIPFYVVAPTSTVDLKCPRGDQIPIELRHADEIRAGKAPAQAECWNPAFDVTPAELVTALITERGVFDSEKLRREGL